MGGPRWQWCTRGHGTCDTTIMVGYCMARRLCLSGSLLCLIATTAGPAAQDAPKIKPSQHGSVSQRIADTTIALEDNRPVARGRDLFGALVPYGKIWCPCADDATTIELSTGVKVDGQDLAVGRYSVWTIPNDGKWTVIFNRRAATWHTRYPDGQDALRLGVRHAPGLAHGDAGVLLSGSRREKG